MEWRKGARPSRYFDPAFYLAHNGEVAVAGVNPLPHYVALGEAETRTPSPYFNVRWYRAAYGLNEEEPCLKHYLEQRLTCQVNPVPLFDAGYCLDNNPDVAAAGVNPSEYLHLVSTKLGPSKGKPARTVARKRKV